MNDPITNSEKYIATWESLDRRPLPSWFQDARFGIFIHWGVYSVPAWRRVEEGRYASYAEWYYARVMFDEDNGGAEFHQRVFGADFEYRDFAPQFRAERWLATPDEVLPAQYAGISGVEHTYLAISGGGANGSYGAGLMVGWAEKEDWSEFTIVSGFSTGALTAPFVFLGPDYDDWLEAIYTSYSTKDLAKERGILKGLTSDAMADSAPLRRLIARYMDAELLEAIAVEHRKGRALSIGTTNLDAMRPVVWDIGNIAVSGHPRALELFHDILMASSALPIASPPVLFEIEVEGRRYDELHVDGVVTTQVFLIPTQLDWDAVLEKLNVPGRPKVYVLRNGMLDPRWETTEPSVLNLAGRTLDSLIRTQGLGDVSRIFLDTLEEGMDYNLTYIPGDFDREYMRALFEVGRERALHGEPWQSNPPGFEHLGDEQGKLIW